MGNEKIQKLHANLHNEKSFWDKTIKKLVTILPEQMCPNDSLTRFKFVLIQSVYQDIEKTISAGQNSPPHPHHFSKDTSLFSLDSAGIRVMVIF